MILYPYDKEAVYRKTEQYRNNFEESNDVSIASRAG